MGYHTVWRTLSEPPFFRFRCFYRVYLIAGIQLGDLCVTFSATLAHYTEASVIDSLAQPIVVPFSSAPASR